MDKFLITSAKEVYVFTQVCQSVNKIIQKLLSEILWNGWTIQGLGHSISNHQGQGH